MQIWQPGYDVRDDGDYAVHLNKGNERPFVIIDLSGDGSTALVIQSRGEADRLLRAAAKAKGLLAEAEVLARAPAGYRLACGCTDDRGCSCPGCQAGKAHEPGEGRHCDEHGTTTVAEVVRETPKAGS